MDSVLAITKHGPAAQGVQSAFSVSALNPQQELFASYYLDPNSITFSNCYQSAKRAGFADSTAKNLTHNNPKWLSEIYGKMQQEVGPEVLMGKLFQIIEDSTTRASDRIRAIELLMRHYGMFIDRSVNVNVVTIEDALNGLN